MEGGFSAALAFPNLSTFLLHRPLSARACFLKHRRLSGGEDGQHAKDFIGPQATTLEPFDQLARSNLDARWCLLPLHHIVTPRPSFCFIPSLSERNPHCSRHPIGKSFAHELAGPTAPAACAACPLQVACSSTAPAQNVKAQGGRERAWANRIRIWRGGKAGRDLKACTLH